MVGNVAASADQEAVVLLTVDGVWNATKGYAGDIRKEGFQPLQEVMQTFVKNGGRSGSVGLAQSRAGSLTRTSWKEQSL